MNKKYNNIFWYYGSSKNEFRENNLTKATGNIIHYLYSYKDEETSKIAEELIKTLFLKLFFRSDMKEFKYKRLRFQEAANTRKITKKQKYNITDQKDRIIDAIVEFETSSKVVTIGIESKLDADINLKQLEDEYNQLKNGETKNVKLLLLAPEEKLIEKKTCNALRHLQKKTGKNFKWLSWEKVYLIVERIKKKNEKKNKENMLC